MNPYIKMHVLTDDEYTTLMSQPEKVMPPESLRSICAATKPQYSEKSSKFKCNICNAVFDTKKELTLHLKEHPLQVKTKESNKHRHVNFLDVVKVWSTLKNE